MSRSDLREHAKRSALQAGWRNTEAHHLTFIPWWESKEHQDNQIADILVTCSCKTWKCDTCKCARINQKCLDFCSCTRKCSNV